MIIEYDDIGRIIHAINDPVAKEVREFYLARPGAMEATRGIGIGTHYVVDGTVKERPTPAVVFSAAGRTVSISGTPEGSAVNVVIEDQTVPIDGNSFELDEPGPVTIIVTPPWPMTEVRHDLEIE